MTLLPKARLRISGWVAYQHEQGEPIVVELRHVRALEGGEQEFIRRIKVGQERQPLPLGWVKKAACVVIENREGEGLQVQPDPETAAAIDARIVEVGVVCGAAFLPAALVRPGMQYYLEPADASSLQLRCLKGEAHCTVTVFPA